MSDVGALARLKLRELANRAAQFHRQSRFKALVVAAFSVAFWWSLYRLFHGGMAFLQKTALQYSFSGLIGAMFYIFFFALTMMLVFSNAVIGYTSYFKSRETGFLLAMPARPEAVFLYKYVESLGFSSWAFLFLGTPLMAAYGKLFEVPWTFYPGTALLLAAYMFVPAGLGALVSMLVTVHLPRSKKSLIALFALGVLGGGMVLVSKFLVIRSAAQVDVRMVSEVFESIEFSRNPFLPSFWLSKGILEWGEGRPGKALFFLGVILSNGFFLGTLAYGLSGRYLLRGWHLSQGLRSARRYDGRNWVDRTAGLLLWFTDRNVRIIVAKDLKGFFRDPVQWSQFLIFFGLLAIYFLNLRTFAYEDRDMFWKNLIAQMNLLATSLTLATFASRFVYPQLSLEGRRFWVVGMAPMDREKILFGKLALSFSTSLLISEALIGLSSVMLKTPPTLAILHAVSLFGICLGLSGLAVGLGALYPNFSEDNPSKIVSGFGGTLNLVLSLLFVLGVLGAQAVPCFFYFGRVGSGGLSGDEFRWLILGSMATISALSLAACLIPLGTGLRALQRLEI
jgi:ABC-2 type transport system permease protein